MCKSISQRLSLQKLPSSSFPSSATDSPLTVLPWDPKQENRMVTRTICPSPITANDGKGIFLENGDTLGRLESLGQLEQNDSIPDLNGVLAAPGTQNRHLPKALLAVLGDPYFVNLRLELLPIICMGYEL